MVPPIEVWNIEAWWELGELGRKAFSEDDPELRAIVSYDAADYFVESALQHLQISKERGLGLGLCKVLNITSAEEERKLIEKLERVPESEFYEVGVRFVQTQLGLPEDVVDECLALKARDVFRFPVTEQVTISEQYPSEGPGGTRYSFIEMRQGAPPTHMVYLAEEFDCIPTSHREVDRRILELWAKKMGITDSLHSAIELTHAITGVSLDVLNDVPLDFVLSVREKGYATKLRAYLESGWDEIRSARGTDEFDNAFRAFDANVQTVYDEFQAEWSDVRTQAKQQFGLAGISGLGTVASAVLMTQPLWIAGTALAVRFGEVGVARLGELRKLRRNPLFVFLRLQQGKRSV